MNAYYQDNILVFIKSLSVLVLLEKIGKKANILDDDTKEF